MDEKTAEKELSNRYKSPRVCLRSFLPALTDQLESKHEIRVKNIYCGKSNFYIPVTEEII